MVTASDSEEAAGASGTDRGGAARQGGGDHGGLGPERHVRRTGRGRQPGRARPVWQVKAVVQPASMDDAGPELAAELIAYCRDHLAHYKCPRSVDFRADLPRHPTGKLLKRVLRDEYARARAVQEAPQ